MRAHRKPTSTQGSAPTYDGDVVTGTANDPLVREALMACRLFAGLDETRLDLVVGALRARRFRRGETIFHGGDPGDALFIVSSGSVKILVTPEDGSEPAILTVVGPGGFFGELALLDGAARSATAVAVEQVETLVLRRDAFDHLVDDDAGIRRALLGALASEIRRLTAQVEDLHKTKESLVGMIEELDVMIKKQSDSSFRNINKHFDEFFKRLFDGGSASLWRIASR